MQAHTARLSLQQAASQAASQQDVSSLGSREGASMQRHTNQRRTNQTLICQPTQGSTCSAVAHIPRTKLILCTSMLGSSCSRTTTLILVQAAGKGCLSCTSSSEEGQQEQGPAGCRWRPACIGACQGVDCHAQSAGKPNSKPWAGPQQ